MTAVIRSITPDKIATSNLNLWLKAESLSGYTNGANITSWNDSSVNGYNFTIVGTAPTCISNIINGGNGLTYNATSWIQNTTGSLTNSSAGNFFNNFSIFIVCYRTITTSNVSVLIDKGSSNFQTNGWYIDGNSMILNKSGSYNGINAGTSFAYSSSGLNFGYLNNWKIISFIIQSNGTGQGWMNGIAGIPNNTLFTTTSNSSNLNLGFYGVGNTNWGGYIAEVIIYNTALTDLQRRDVENYLRLKFMI